MTGPVGPSDMRHAAAVIALVLCPAAARAASVVYEHPALKARLTVHVDDGATAPDTIAYEGPKGFFLITAAVERTIAELVSRGKQEAPDEFAARAAALRREARETRASWSSYETLARDVPGSILDKTKLDAAEAPLKEVAAAVDAAGAERVGGECRAASAAATSAEPNPKAEFYRRQGRALDAAAAELSRVREVLRTAQIPAY